MFLHYNFCPVLIPKIYGLIHLYDLFTIIFFQFFQNVRQEIDVKLIQGQKEGLSNMWAEQNQLHLVSGLEFNMMNHWENTMACTRIVVSHFLVILWQCCILFFNFFPITSQYVSSIYLNTVSLLLQILQVLFVDHKCI